MKNLWQSFLDWLTHDPYTNETDEDREWREW